jgi:osmotically-inducible protein OsmY
VVAGAEQSGSEPTDYVVERLRQALAHDPRVGELDVEVMVAGGKVFLTGQVPTAARRDAITEVAEELLPDRDVHNGVTVETIDESAQPEQLS